MVCEIEDLEPQPFLHRNKLLAEGIRFKDPHQVSCCCLQIYGVLRPGNVQRQIVPGLVPKKYQKMENRQLVGNMLGYSIQLIKEQDMATFVEF